MRPDQRLSNIYKLYRATRVGPDNNIDPSEQFAFYDAGLGTAQFDGPWWTTPLTTIRKTFSSATGSGVSRNIADCYEAIMKHARPDDRLYFFGFSRGGYTARCLANTIALCGIPTTGASGAPLPTGGKALRAIADEAVNKVYDHCAGKRDKKYADQQQELARRFRAKYGSTNFTDPTRANVAPYFIGVFDSVSALGMNWITRSIALTAIGMFFAGSAWLAGSLLNNWFGWPVDEATAWVFLASGVAASTRFLKNHLKFITKYPEGAWLPKWHFAIWRFSRDESDTRLDKKVEFARQALAIDERRYSFARVLWGQKSTDHEGTHPTIKRFVQLWFAGNHSDIGGSYPEDESRLSDIPLSWMVDEATSLPHPIKVDWTKLHLFPRPDGIQHCEVENTLDSFPSWWPKRLRRFWRTDTRWTASGAPHHDSVAERFALAEVTHCGSRKPYRPLALSYDPIFGEKCQAANLGQLPPDAPERLAKIIAASNAS